MDGCPGARRSTARVRTRCLRDRRAGCCGARCHGHDCRHGLRGSPGRLVPPSPPDGPTIGAPQRGGCRGQARDLRRRACSRPLRFESPRRAALRLLLSPSSPADPWSVPRYATTPRPCPFPPGRAGRNAIGFRGGLCPHTVRLDLCQRACSGPLARNGSLAPSRSRPPASVRRTRPPTPTLAGLPEGTIRGARHAPGWPGGPAAAPRALGRTPKAIAGPPRQETPRRRQEARQRAQEAPGPGKEPRRLPRGARSAQGGARRDLPRYARTRGRGGPERPTGLAHSLAGNWRKSASVICAN